MNILKGECRPHPFILFGPPGTGKTRTIVESILQITRNIQGSRVVACAPSNTCADQLALKLIQSGNLKERDIARIIAVSRIDKVPEELDNFVIEPSEADPNWIYRKIIISTCGSVGHLFELQKRPGFFTHCFIDEAAQATEPEAMQVLNMVALGKGMTILAGDPYQLGPVCMSPQAKRYGLGKSMLGRLFTMKPYRRTQNSFQEYGSYDPRCITKLIESYRCCMDLIYVNSKMFYASELECKVDSDNELLEELGIGFPVVFEGVRGKDERDDNSSSWYNSGEVLVVTQYLKRLYEAGVDIEDIGVITPYRKQTEKLRQFIEFTGLPKCKIATVEEFQGSERRVMILSLVRTTPENIDIDLKKHLGFVANEQRFNVATTRAKSLLIVIGDPFCLVVDGCWKAFISYCMLKNSYVGIEFTINDVHKAKSIDLDVAEKTHDDK